MLGEPPFGHLTAVRPTRRSLASRRLPAPARHLSGGTALPLAEEMRDEQLVKEIRALLDEVLDPERQERVYVPLS